MRRFFRSAAFPILIVIVLAFFAQRLLNHPSTQPPPTLGQFLAEVKSDPRSFEDVTFQPKSNTIQVKLQDGKEYSVGYPNNYEPQLVNTLQRNHVEFNAEGTGGSSFLSILTYILPFILFFGFWVFLMNQMQGGGSRVMSFGKSRAKRMSVDAPKITFRDVAGVDEAVQELQEIKEFLENPKRFQALGARIPKGVLLYGPPGTGKTLLARAVAGEAGVPFFSISGSDFVEMFVGVGASRVRDLFEQAKQNSPCIIFMDEIDAVGRHRGAGMGGGHDEREQTLNQLLVEMDGFEMKDNIILIAATNRPDILDPALLRPGRFDRQIVVDRPDRKGRKQILEVHTRGKPLAKQIDLDALAGQTPGFTGADLANLINEAALLTARSSKREITMIELEEGIMRVIAGPEKKSRVMSEKERLVTAYHELGHAIVGHLLPNTDPVHKVSIISRGQALGYTISLPTEDKFLTTRAELTDTMAMTLGGRAAEEIIFGEITTGASNDLEKVTETAKQMVMRYGMSERLGPRVFGHDRSMPFLGREFSAEPDYSDEIAREIDDEIRRFVEEAHQTAKDILAERREGLDRISKILLERETIDAEQFMKLLEGRSEEEVFGEPEEEPTAPEAPPEPEKKAGREGPRPVPRPRPGFAGTADMRADPPDA
jgi:cell division protease FtsH